MRKLIGRFRLPSAEVVAQRELAEAQRDLLKAQSGLDYAKAMVQYHAARVARLQQYLDGTQNAEPS